MTQQARAIFLKMFAIPHNARRPNDLGKSAFALDQRRPSPVITIQVEEIESVEDELTRAPGRQGVLQGGEIRRPAAAFGDHFAVNDRLLNSEIGQSAGEDNSEPRSPIQAASGKQLHSPSTDMRLQPVAVELDFMEPIWAGGRTAPQAGERGRDKAGKAKLCRTLR